MQFVVDPGSVQDAVVAVPGDKSISHRAVMLGSIANGSSDISGFLNGEDCLATLSAMGAMGVQTEQHDATTLTVHGVGLHGLQAPPGALDMGNSGTAMRLMTGLLAGQVFSSRLIGDESLTGRPMQRIITPLNEMGASIGSRDGRPPLEIQGGQALRSIHYDLPVASAQVKSAVLLAGLYADGITSVTEPAVTRDHTERMLNAMGVEVRRMDGRIAIKGGQELTGGPVAVPGDLSSAAFVLLAACISDTADVLVKNIGVNPTRIGVIDILQAMGGEIALVNQRERSGEAVADIRVRASRLEGIEVDPGLVSLAIDEFPALFVAAACARGTTTFSGIGELRVKESDRIAAMATGLRELGIRVDESEDGAVVHGGRFGGGTVDSFGDHRIAMSLAVAGTIADAPVTVRNTGAVATSFPGFIDLFRTLGARMAEEAL
jgi:3-phosphoshikimate 1-carboxyvinyltransferase